MERNCTLLINHDIKGSGNVVAPTEDELRKELEATDPKKKVRGLKALILLLLNGQSLPKLLMTVIRFCVTTRDHELKKLLSLYWEVVTKYDQQGKILPEMILVCNAILNDLKHPNHFIRGCTLRFLCRIKDLEIIQPLIPAIEENLTHSDAYVRKNAVMAVYTIYKNFPDLASGLFPDGAQMIEKVLDNETDPTARRNSFLMLYKCEQDRAVEFFVKNSDKVLKYGEDFQFIVLELTRKVCMDKPQEKSRFIKTLFQLLQSSSSAICYETSWTLVSLSSAPTAVRAAAQAYVNILNNTESDNNVRLIVLEHLAGLKKYHGKVIQELLMDILRVLNVQNRDIRQKTLDICMDLVSLRNINEVVLVLKKEVLKTQRKDLDQDDSTEYRQMLIKAIHGCAVRYPSIADGVVHILMEFLAGESESSGGLEVMLFVREIVETYPALRETVIEKLIQTFPDIAAAPVYRVALWILGEYAVDINRVNQTWDSIIQALGSIPLSLKAGKPERDVKKNDAKLSEPKTKTTVAVLADGTYATQTALTMKEKDLVLDTEPNLRKLILGGNYLLGACVVSAMMKIILKERATTSLTAESVGSVNRHILQTVKLCCSLLQIGQSGDVPANQQIDKDSYERINLYIRILMDVTVSKEVEGVLLADCRTMLQALLDEHKKLKAQQEKGDDLQPVQPDQLIFFRQLKSSRGLGVQEMDLDDDLELSKAALGQEARESRGTDELSFKKELQSVYQLTGFGDPVYAEAQVSVHGYDIIVDILVINRTDHTLLDLTVELATLGDLQLVERPSSINLAKQACHSFKANIKVRSTESGQIFGTIVYENSSKNNVENETGDKVVYVNLNYINIDVMDYIKPAYCSDDSFRTMWAEFEWENKVAVNTSISDVHEYLDHVVKSTNMKCLTSDITPKSITAKTKFDLETKEEVSETPTEKDKSDFLAANLYAKSIFGEDALVNISVENVGGKVEGYIRIRAKTQGIALSLGDRINMKQKAKNTVRKI